MSKKVKQELERAKTKFSDEYLNKVLTSNGQSIADYYIFLIHPKDLTGLIYYWWQGQTWISMDDDDFNLAWIDF
ncbi:hypothetical protein [Fischerella sp. JS2]|uniref:hypothetical protein n=1 Tax=Fischerella sp. JS2 TaxID=2597771 RepID=UPI0028E84391|nr:hypothetical protein [Fischerella sp. JS2]